MKLPPIKLRRLYPKHGGPDFTIVAEPLPADVHARMTDADHIERREAERMAIDAEWKKIRAVN